MLKEPIWYWLAASKYYKKLWCFLGSVTFLPMDTLPFGNFPIYLHVGNTISLLNCKVEQSWLRMLLGHVDCHLDLAKPYNLNLVI